MEKSLMRQARKHQFKKGSKRYNAYVYGTLQKHKHIKINPLRKQK